jgi:hypothetical protein
MAGRRPVRTRRVQRASFCWRLPSATSLLRLVHGGRCRLAAAATLRRRLPRRLPEILSFRCGLSRPIASGALSLHIACFSRASADARLAFAASIACGSGDAGLCVADLRARRAVLSCRRRRRDRDVDAGGLGGRLRVSQVGPSARQGDLVITGIDSHQHLPCLDGLVLADGHLDHRSRRARRDLVDVAVDLSVVGRVREVPPRRDAGEPIAIGGLIRMTLVRPFMPFVTC